MIDPVALCAAGEAAWHRVAYSGLGATWIAGDGIAFGTAPHRFLNAAVTLAPTPAIPAEVAGDIHDSWGALSADQLPGWSCKPADVWMLRLPGPCAPPTVANVRIARTADELLFERIAFLGAGGVAPDSPGELHPVGSSAQPGMHLFLAWQDDQPVGTALAVEYPGGVTVSAVAVVAQARRCGIGSMLTAAAVSVAPDRPATLCATQLGVGTYRRLGFTVVGRGLDWSPPA